MLSKYKINKNLLFIGDLNTYTRTFQRYKILEKIFQNTHTISSEKIFVPGIHKNNKNFIFRFFFKFGIHLDNNNINKNIHVYIKKFKIDVIWIEKVNCLSINLIKLLRNNHILIYYTNDNINKFHNISINYVFFIKYFHFLLIPKDYSLKTKKNRPKVYKFYRSFDNNYIPMKKNYEKKTIDIVFIGTYEKERFETLNNAANNLNYVIEIFGNGWSKVKNANHNLIIHNKPLYNQELLSTLRKSKIALNFLRKKNNDQTTGRSFEILATNTFMISEISKVHLELFENHKECVYFRNYKDLVKNINFYLKNEDKRETISNNGFNKVHESYTYQIWINDFLKNIYEY